MLRKKSKKKYLSSRIYQHIKFTRESYKIKKFKNFQMFAQLLAHKIHKRVV